MTECTRGVRRGNYGGWKEGKVKCDWEMENEGRVTSSGLRAYIAKMRTEL